MAAAGAAASATKTMVITDNTTSLQAKAFSSFCHYIPASSQNVSDKLSYFSITRNNLKHPEVNFKNNAIFWINRLYEL